LAGLVFSAIATGGFISESLPGLQISRLDPLPKPPKLEESQVQLLLSRRCRMPAATWMGKTQVPRITHGPRHDNTVADPVPLAYQPAFGMDHSILPKHVARVWPVQRWRNFTVLAGVSGGPDSICLLRVMHRLWEQSSGRGQLVAVHVNHQARGQASEDDARMVRQLGERLQIPVVVRRLPPPPDTWSGNGPESWLREERYGVFEQVARQTGARFLLTGHHRDDQAETVLFRILRGTGMQGLCGIPFARTINESLTVVRPLLQVPRREILDYLQAIGQPFREDASNRNEQYTRNRLRHEVLPALQSCFDNEIEQSLVNLAELAGRQARLLQHLAEPLYQRHFQLCHRLIRIDWPGLQPSPPELVLIALRRAWREAGFPERDMNAAGWQALTQLCICPPEQAATRMFPGGIRVSRSGSQLVLQPGDRVSGD
jgi:tRNA(Ile)-lysidine synthase